MLIVIGQSMGAIARSVRAPNRDPMSLLGCSTALIGLALLTFGIMYLLMVDRFRRRFREQTILARQSWAAHRPI